MAWQALAGAAAGAGLDYFSNQAANNASRAAANRQMAFQKKVLQNSHQWEVSDLRKAGLNPILSANSGADSAGGASMNVQKADYDVDPMLFHNVKQSKATTDNIVADTGLKAANTRSADKNLEIQAETKKLLQAQGAKEGELARSAKQTADLQDKYGEASQVMGLINSGTGSIGNLLGVGNLLRQAGNLFKSKPQYTPKNSNRTEHMYDRQGEHVGSKEIRYGE